MSRTEAMVLNSYASRPGLFHGFGLYALSQMKNEMKCAVE